MKANNMYAALTAILDKQVFNDSRTCGLSVPFSVEPVPDADWDNYIDNDSGLDIAPAHRLGVPGCGLEAGLFCVKGWGEASLGYIYHVCDESGNNVATYYST